MHDEYCRIAADVVLGRNVKVHAFVNLYGCEIGAETRIGAFVEIQKGVVIGPHCKISSHTFICEGVTIAKNVFIGHGVVFINDSRPRAVNDDGKPATEADWTVQHTFIKAGASIGSGTTLLGGITVGEKALIGAGSVVTKNVPPGAVVAGNPARLLNSARNGSPMKNRTRDPYDYVEAALDQLFLLRQHCKISVKSEGLLDKAEVALTELLDSVNTELKK